MVALLGRRGMVGRVETGAVGYNAEGKFRMAVAKPVIALTLDWNEENARYELLRSYAAAVEEAGGVPVALPYVTDAAGIGGMLEICDGLVLTGGAFDIAPALYGEQRHDSCGAEKAERTAFEWKLCELALARGLPLLGVCGGMQLLNVVLGGSLWQDIPADLGLPSHEQPAPKDAPSHMVDVVPSSLLARAVGDTPLPVNSTHHQAVREPGRGLFVSGRASDGVIEAVESDDHRFVLGVQWHPEAVMRHEPRHAGIYRALAQEAAAWRKARRRA